MRTKGHYEVLINLGFGVSHTEKFRTHQKALAFIKKVTRPVILIRVEKSGEKRIQK